jgi:tetratricopeptide (TPR) repeat protein
MKARRQTSDELIRAGLALHRENKVAEAARCYENALRIDRRSYPATYFLALTCGQTGQHRKAAELMGRAIAIDPSRPEAHFNRGYALLELKQVEEAEQCFARAVALKPDYTAAWLQRGVALYDLDRFEEALASCDMAVAQTPYDPIAHYKRGVALKALKRFEPALAAYDRAIALKSNEGEFWASRGVVLHRLDRSPEALESYDKALELDRKDARSWSNRGNTLMALSRFEEALTSHDKALALDEDLADAYHNRAHVRLLVGDFARGLEDYEWRKVIDQAVGDRNFDQPLWLGAQAIAGKTILVHDEQGLGDAIQFSRYLSLLNEAGARVLFAPRVKLARLMRTLKADFEMADPRDRSLSFDFHCPLLSLPLAFGTTLDTIPAAVPYLRAEPERIARWSKALGRGKLTIGICWHGSRDRGDDRGRSFPVTHFRGISEIPGVHLISIHKGKGELELDALPDDMALELPGPEFDAGDDAFIDTAAVMACCDLIITSDTSVAHLAGALARPVWVVLKHVPDWRWQLDRSDSPWYPTMRLFRQSEPRNWQSAFAQIEAELKQMLAMAD